MNRALAFYRSTIGKKVVMALTGIVGLGYLVGHVSGNLLVFRGAQAINDYAHFLHTSPVILWGTRAILIVSVLLHIDCALKLTLRNVAARPQAYAKKTNIQAGWGARTMRVSALILLGFIVIHIAHLTFGAKAFDTDFAEGDAYGNVVRGFQQKWLSGFYLLAMLAVGLHLAHGIWSTVQTLGLSHPSRNRLVREAAIVVTVILVGGFSLIPIAVLMGKLTL